jgi:hypothetical protein
MKSGANERKSDCFFVFCFCANLEIVECAPAIDFVLLLLEAAAAASEECNSELKFNETGRAR